MPVRPDEKYSGTVTSAMFTVSQARGTPGLHISVRTEDGPAEGTFWVTEGTVQRLQENLSKCFGITEEMLQDEKFLSGGISEFVIGQPVSIVTEAETDANGNVRTSQKTGLPFVTIKWINPSRAGKKAPVDAIRKVSSLFGGGQASSDQPADPASNWTPTDDDVPF